MKSNQNTVFHLSIHVNDLEASRAFYAGVLGCQEGRSTQRWVDFDFFGHQLSVHLGTPTASTLTGEVDGAAVPMPHFGAVLPLEIWQAVADRLQKAGTEYLLDPQERYPDETGAQRILFVRDPSGNAIELKCLQNHAELFESSPHAP